VWPIVSVEELAMWIFHPALGHFSVVVPRNQQTGAREQDRLMVRARRREHLELLGEAHPVLSKAKILRSARADYMWRILVPREHFAQAMREMAEQIQFTNVKSEAAMHTDKVGADYVRMLHNCHGLFAKLQDRQADEPGE
jgi:hypothetical protein